MDTMKRLLEILSSYSSAVIAFSGGVDSTFLAKVAKDAISGKVLLVTATSSTYPFFELEESKSLAKLIGLEQRIITSEEVDIPGFADNPPDRCYYCKSGLFTLVKHIAGEEGYQVVFDGSNADDTKDYRPGMRALAELGIVSPLRSAGMTKEDIRKFSRELNLPTADKPSFACLASRFPYGERITKEKLARTEKAETGIRDLGFSQFRVRNHEELARLEFIPAEMDRAWQLRETLIAVCKQAGYVFVAIDAQGYRAGAMNETLSSSLKSS
jgi:uncharacterized protein